MLYIATTREQAKRIMFKDVLKVISRNFKLTLGFNHTTLEVTFPNGSMIYLMGMDSKPEEMEKALGQKYRKVYIDEAGSWKQDLEHLVHSVLEPACADLEGSICMMGSPVSNTKSYFFQLTNRPELHLGWSSKKWTWDDNPHVRIQMQKQIDRKVAVNPRIVETAAFKQMYLGQWVIDPGNLVYKFNGDRNKIDALPKEHNYHYVLGLDLGFTDETAFVISAYSPSDKNMYIVEVIKRAGLDITGVAEYLTRLRHQYDPFKYIVDGASRQAVEELRNRWHFPLESSDKTGKADVIEIMNADFVMGRIKLLPGAESLELEYADLVWDQQSKKREEHPGCSNHASDGALYSWRMCYHYLSQDAIKKPTRNSSEEMDIWWERQASLGSKTVTEDFAKRDFGKDYGFH